MSFLTLDGLGSNGSPPMSWSDWYKQQSVREFQTGQRGGGAQAGELIFRQESPAMTEWRRARAAERAAGVRGPAMASSNPEQFKRQLERQQAIATRRRERQRLQEEARQKREEARQKRAEERAARDRARQQRRQERYDRWGRPVPDRSPRTQPKPPQPTEKEMYRQWYLSLKSQVEADNRRAGMTTGAIRYPQSQTPSATLLDQSGKAAVTSVGTPAGRRVTTFKPGPMPVQTGTASWNDVIRASGRLWTGSGYAPPGGGAAPRPTAALTTYSPTISYAMSGMSGCCPGMFGFSGLGG